MWLLLVTMWSAQPPVYAGIYPSQMQCEAMGYRVSKSYGQDIASFKCIEVPR